MSRESEHNRRGLVKLMLRVPALRERLQAVSASNADMFSLCGAYEDASSTLDRLRKEKSQKNPAIISEYERLCEEIEQEIIEICSR
jgi:hypothetical protein